MCCTVTIKKINKYALEKVLLWGIEMCDENQFVGTLMEESILGKGNRSTDSNMDEAKGKQRRRRKENKGGELVCYCFQRKFGAKWQKAFLENAISLSVPFFLS